jgi:AcrR family transcriptional regulator
MDTAQESRRATLRSGEDEQSRATRALLIGAYEQAAAARLRSPSVTWMCERAGVGRSTFYTHFASVEELAITAITAGFEPISVSDTDRRRAHPDQRRAIAGDGLHSIIENLERARPVLEYTLRIGSRAALLTRLIEQFALHTRQTVALEYEGLDAARLEVVTEYVSAGAAHSVLRWIEGGTALTRAELVAQLLDLLPAPLIR